MTLRLRYFLFLSALTALTLWFVWPIYQDVYLFATALGALLAGGFIGGVNRVRNHSMLTTTWMTLLAYLVLSLPLSNPRALSSPQALVQGFLEAIVGPVDAWKQIITIDLPIGTYHALLAPVMVLYLLTGVIFGRLLFGQMSRYWLAGIPVVSIVIFAISFGVINVPGDFVLLGVRFPVETPLVTGGALFVLLIIYLNWGARATRRETLLIRQESIGFTTNLLFRKLRKTLVATGVIVLAVSVTALSMQFAGITSNRSVLRSGVEKVRDLRQQASPLSGYRMFFTKPELLEGQLLKFSATGAPDRIRIATMPYFNGETFTVAPADENAIDDNMLFSRVPSDLPTSGNGRSESFDIEVAGLNAIWLPIAANSKRITFAGANAANLSDALFVNRATGTAAIIPGDSNQSKYRIEYVTAPEVTPEDILPSSPQIDEALIPESLTAWLALQKLPTQITGAELVRIAKILRDRGYLSHGLVEPPKPIEGQKVTWLSSVNGLEFKKSTAGHNLARIEQMFKDLADKQNKMNNKGNLVATAGDDEQFSTAMALVAAAYGFPARVVVGFKTAETDEGSGVPACPISEGEGICQGQNLSAWVEVQGQNGDWLTLDVTPQFEKPLILDPNPKGIPKNPTEAGEDDAGVIPPGKSIPSTDSECLKNPDLEGCPLPPAPLNLAGLWLAIQLALIAAIIVGPFLVILLMKRSRRKSRRKNPSDFARVVGAWEEYLDVTVDYGSPISHLKTRLELARENESPEVLELAELANLMAYGSDEVQSVDLSDAEVSAAAERSWAIFDSQLELITKQTKGFKQIRASISLRSFLRVLKPREELKKLSTAISFKNGAKVFEGSAWKGLLETFRRQARTRFAKK